MRALIARVAAILAPAVLLAGCSQAPEGSQDEAAEMSVPDVTGSSAVQGVAFTFEYTFILPTTAISRVQRQHVTDCEQLGISRCRITGINFEQTRSDDASGSLSLLLAPADAYRFSGRAVELVEAAKGAIETAQVNGHNAAGAATQASRNQSGAQNEIARLEQQLKNRNLAESERQNIQMRLDEQHRLVQESKATRQESQAALTVTPVSFRYAGQSALTGEGRFGRAAQQSWSGLQDMLILVVVLLGYALPWAVLVGLGLWVARWFKRRQSQVGMQGEDGAGA